MQVQNRPSDHCGDAAACPICAAPTTTSLFRQTAFAVRRCRQCHVVFVEQDSVSVSDHAHALPESAAARQRRYAAAIARSYHYIDTVFISRHEFWLAHWNRRLDRIERILGRTGRLLDIGCAVGHFQLAAEARGWESIGIEPSIPQSDYARRRFGLDVRTAFWEDVNFAAGEFDLISAWSVLEHVAQPRSFLKQLRRWLKPDGLLALQTPNQASLISDLARWGYRLSGGRYLLPIYSDEHRYRFDEAALQRLFELTNLAPVVIERYDNLAVMQARMAMEPRRRRRNAALTAIHGVAGLTGRQNQLIAYAHPAAERGRVDR